MGKIYRKTRAFLAALGLLTFLFFVALLLDGPGWGFRWLEGAPYTSDSDYIVLLPAGGIPDPAMLMRAYTAAEESAKNRKAKVIISLKADPPLETSTIWGIRNELVLRGVPKELILLETRATNTADHAKYIKAAHMGDPLRDKYLLVTSPTHVRRSMMTFRHAGFKHLYAKPAIPGIEKEDLGGGQYIRYCFWNALVLSVHIARETLAIAWYKVSGKA